jgi:hypothetical protein
MERYLWKFFWDCGRQGDVSSLFVATEEEIADAIGQSVYFGEILGKHSEVSGTIDEGEITKIDLDSETVEKVAAILGDTWNGRNPLHYIQYECRICGDSYSSDEYSDDSHLQDRVCRYCEAEEKE